MRSQVVKNNRRQILLFAILTLILTLCVVLGGRIWLKNSETLVFAVGDANGTAFVRNILDIADGSEAAARKPEAAQQP